MSKDVVEEFAPRRVFQNDPDVFVGFDDIVQANNIGMFESLGQGSMSGNLRSSKRHVPAAPRFRAQLLTSEQKSRYYPF
jgi:hypothetical protein